MASPSDDPGRRNDDRGDPDRVPPRDGLGETMPDDAGRTDAGQADEAAYRDGSAERAEPRPTGRDDDLDGDLGGDLGGERTSTHAEIEDRTVPSLDENPVGSETNPEPETGQTAHPHSDEHDDQQARSGFAATALKIMLLVLVIFGLSLWLVPMMAPNLPAGLARILMPGQAELDQRLAALADRIEENTSQISADVVAMRGDIAALTEQIGAVEQTAAAARTEAEAARTAAEQSATSAEQNVVAGDSVNRAEGAAREASGLAETATTAATEAGKVASAASRDTASLARRMTEFDARLATLSDQIDAMNESLASGGADGEVAAPELAAAVAALQTELDALSQQAGDAPELVTQADAQRFATQDDLRSARTALEAQITEALAPLPPAPQIVVEDELRSARTALEAQITQALAALPPAPQIVVKDELDQLRQNADARTAEVSGRVDTVEAIAAQAAAAAAAAAQAANTAVGRIDEAIRQASLRSTAAALISRLENGLPYAAELAEAAKLQGTRAPLALVEPAETGIATTAALLARFGQASRAALEADIGSRAGDGLLSQARARVSSVVAGRPSGEQQGEGVDAILSRVEARLREGEPLSALFEAEDLPEPAKGALGAWLDDLKTRVFALRAAEDWLGAAGTTTGTTGG